MIAHEMYANKKKNNKILRKICKKHYQNNEINAETPLQEYVIFFDAQFYEDGIDTIKITQCNKITMSFSLEIAKFVE